MQLISEAREICPNLVLRSGEDLTPFRKTSKDIFNATKSFFVHYVNKINAEIANNNNNNDDDDQQPDDNEPQSIQHNQYVVNRRRGGRKYQKSDTLVVL